jgi:hypothetical protein
MLPVARTLYTTALQKQTTRSFMMNTAVASRKIYFISNYLGRTPQQARTLAHPPAKRSRDSSEIDDKQRAVQRTRITSMHWITHWLLAGV